ncbi:sensor domain-containing diguanylate cyclase [Vibrio jasicida]|uniref:sensor domain-containing diguanylate cyclase n=1 Tax=Vibrio jasicida TaxID=766224 RepID=UPI0003A0FE81|nr:sensor domain-containing diguanylate cyclase [Vibrio jasicida]
MPNTVAKEGFIQRNKVSISVFLSLILVTAAMTYGALRLQQRYALTIFNTLADRQTQSIKFFVENDLEFIGAGANFFQTVSPSSWHKFSRYSEQIVRGSKSLIGLQWLQRVEKNDLKSYIKKMREQYKNFDIYTIPKGQDKKEGYILKDDSPIYVITDVFPKTEANLDLIGFYSSRERFDLVIRDIENNYRPAISDNVNLLQYRTSKTTEPTGILVYHPVFNSEKKRLLGVMVGVLKSSVYFENLVVKTATESDLLIKVTDLGFDGHDRPTLFASKNWDYVESEPLSRIISLPNRNWLIEFKLSNSISTWDRTMLYSIAIFGLTISFLICYIVNLQINDKERLAVMLDSKTRELKEMAEKDSLTYLYNRRMFNLHLRKFIDGSTPFSLVGFDIDHFKKINDEYGHIAGDEAIIHITKMIKSKLRKRDLFYRTGGDEFCILTRLVQKEDLDKYLESLRLSVSESSFVVQGSRIPCTISIGAASYANETPADLYHKMDEQLYESKRKGRNSVSIFTE